MDQIGSRAKPNGIGIDVGERSETADSTPREVQTSSAIHGVRYVVVCMGPCNVRRLGIWEKSENAI